MSQDARRAFVPSALVGALIGLLLMAGTAWAHHIDSMVPVPGAGPGNQTSNKQTDNAAVYYYMDSNGAYELETVDKNTVNNMLDAEYRPTVLAFHYDSTPVFSGGAETDTIWQEGAVSGSDEGTTWCDNPVGLYACDQHYIRIEGAGTYTKGLTCHEMGHAVGLVHGLNAAPSVPNQDASLRCMRKTVAASDILGTHNRSEINETYD